MFPAVAVKVKVRPRLLFIVSDRGDSNARPPRPERGALPTALLSVSFCSARKFTFPLLRPLKGWKACLSASPRRHIGCKSTNFPRHVQVFPWKNIHFLAFCAKILGVCQIALIGIVGFGIGCEVGRLYQNCCQKAIAISDSWACIEGKGKENAARLWAAQHLDERVNRIN